jgi:hypothetical protein
VAAQGLYTFKMTDADTGEFVLCARVGLSKARHKRAALLASPALSLQS